MGGAGAAGNNDMLKGAEGQAACTALAQALAACSSLQTLHFGGECGRCCEGRGVVKRDAPVSVCLPPHLHRTCVCGTVHVYVCVCVWMDVCVCCMCITRYHSIRVSTHLFIRPCVSRVDTHMRELRVYTVCRCMGGVSCVLYATSIYKLSTCIKTSWICPFPDMCV